MARLYANENFPLPVVKELRQLAHDVLTIHETGQSGQSVSDENILAFASADPSLVDHQSQAFHPLAQGTAAACWYRCVHV